MKQKPPNSRASSASSSRQNTPRSTIQHPFMSHSSLTKGIQKQVSSPVHPTSLLGTPLGRAYTAPSTLQFPGLGYNSPFESSTLADTNLSYPEVSFNHQPDQQQSIKTSTKDSFIFKAPYPVLKDTPRPYVASSTTAGTKSFIPATPSPLTLSSNDNLMKTPLHVEDPLNHQLHWPKGSGVSSFIGSYKSIEHDETFNGLDADIMEQENETPVISKKVLEKNFYC